MPESPISAVDLGIDFPQKEMPTLNPRLEAEKNRIKDILFAVLPKNEKGQITVKSFRTVNLDTITLDQAKQIMAPGKRELLRVLHEDTNRDNSLNRDLSAALRNIVLHCENILTKVKAGTPYVVEEDAPSEQLVNEEARRELAALLGDAAIVYQKIANIPGGNKDTKLIDDNLAIRGAMLDRVKIFFGDHRQLMFNGQPGAAWLGLLNEAEVSVPGQSSKLNLNQLRILRSLDENLYGLIMVKNDLLDSLNYLKRQMRGYAADAADK